MYIMLVCISVFMHAFNMSDIPHDMYTFCLNTFITFEERNTTSSSYFLLSISILL